MNALFEKKIHRKFFPNDYVSANVVSYAFLIGAEDFAEGRPATFGRMLRKSKKLFGLNDAACIDLADKVNTYLETYTGYLPSDESVESGAGVLACCLLSAIAESEDE